MPVSLNVPAQPPQLLKAKILRINIEINLEQWVELYVGFGNIVEGTFIEYVDAVTGLKIPARYFKIENGNHPLKPGMSLRRCPVCGKWWKLEEACDCEGTPATEPYDGMTRLVSADAAEGSIYNAIAKTLYDFLLAEEIPDPVTWEVAPLLDATEEI